MTKNEMLFVAGVAAMSWAVRLLWQRYAIVEHLWY
jgi:hypothetical protein